MYIKNAILFIILAKMTIFMQIVFCDNDMTNYYNRPSENICSNSTSELKLLSRSRRYLGFKKGARVFVSILIIKITSFSICGKIIIILCRLMECINSF